MKQLLERFLKEDEFEDIFQPITKEEFSSRTMDYIKSVCFQNPDGTWSCKESINLSSRNLVTLPCKFKKVGKSFNCSDNNLTTLEGAPEEVGGGFDCRGNPIPPEKLKKTVDRGYLR